MQEKLNVAIASLFAVAVLLIIGFYAYTASTGQGTERLGRIEEDNNQIVTNEGTTKEADRLGVIQNVREGKIYDVRVLSGGGVGWLMSIAETQPKVFTGKLLTNSGKDNYDLFLQEEAGFYLGEAKNTKDKSIVAFSLEKIDAGTSGCKDVEGVVLPFNTKLSLDEQKLTGCLTDKKSE